MYKPKASSQESPFLYLLLPLVAGILSCRYFTLPAVTFVAMLMLTGAMFRFSRRGTDVCLLLTLFCLGNVLSPRPPSRHFPDSPVLVKARCEKVLTGNNYILSAYGEEFHLSRFRTDTTYRVGDSLTFFARILPFYDNANPHEFSYSQYLQQQAVYFRLIPTTPIAKTGHSADLRSFFEQQRARLLDKTESLTRDTTCAMLMNALCLGYKHDITPELRRLFIETGTIHLLAVSGLHVGIIYLLILFVFKRLRLYGPKSSLLALPLLWSYAMLTGLSPSVVRATLLLSFIDVGKALSRTYNPINILAASACLTLIAQPSALYSLSFLLSYSAYCGILVLYPYLFGLPGKLPRLPSVLYSYVCLTIAAQLPTLPISAYFFHTVNLNGFLANLIAVPVATLLLYGSAICFVVPVGIGRLVIPICELLGKILTGALQWISPYILNVQELYPSGGYVVLLYGSFLAAIGYMLYRKRRFLRATVACLGVLLAYSTYLNNRLSRQQELVVFHYPRHTAILLNHEGFCFPLRNSADTSTHMRPYVLYNRLKPLPDAYGFLNGEITWRPPCLYYHGDTVLIASPEYPLQQSGTTLIVTGNLTPRQAFAASPSPSSPRTVILDGSNSFYTVRLWKEFCKEHRLVCRNTAEEGAIFIQ